MKKAVILLSGGLDSTTCLAIARKEGYLCHALSFNYGQKHDIELKAAQNIAKKLGASEHKIITLDTSLFSGSALTEDSLSVPEYKESNAIPITYVPARNTIFLAMALGYAESIGALDIFIGVSSIDYSHYPDCRPEFIQAFHDLANKATKAGVEGNKITIHAPLQYLSKEETIQLGTKLETPYYLTVSCYQANEEGKACGVCDSCTFRKRGFAEAGISDPTSYQ